MHLVAIKKIRKRKPNRAQSRGMRAQGKEYNGVQKKEKYSAAQKKMCSARK